MIKKSNTVDDTLFLGVIAGITLATLLWVCMVVYDIQQDVKDIRGTLDTMRETLEPRVTVVDSDNNTLQSKMILETDISSKSLD